MTARVNRQAVMVLTWLIVTTSATAMAWWAVTFVTAEVADRLPLRPSDVVAASARQTGPIPSSVYGVQSIEGPPPPASGPPADFVSGVPGVSPALATTQGSGARGLAAPSPVPHVAVGSVPVVGANLVAGRSSTPRTAHAVAAAATAPMTTAALSAPAPVPPPPAAAVAPSREFALTRKPTFVTAAAPAPAPPAPAVPVAAVRPSREFALTRKPTLVAAAAVAPAAPRVAATSWTIRPWRLADPAALTQHSPGATPPEPLGASAPAHPAAGAPG